MATENGKSAPEPEGYRGIQVYVEKKIRNLEKKKNRLDEYQKRLTKGETLEQQQKDALSTMSTVQCNLEFARDVLTYVTQVANEQERQAKKAEKRAKLERDRRELDLVESLLRVQALLEEMGAEEIKEAFSRNDGVNGVALSASQQESLDQLYQAITPRRELESSADEPAAQSWPTQLRSCAECSQHYLEAREDKHLIDSETTYRDVSELVKRLAALPFFTADRQPRVAAPSPPPPPPPQPQPVLEEPVKTTNTAVLHHTPKASDEDVASQQKQQPVDSNNAPWSQPKQWADDPMPETSTSAANGAAFQSGSAPPQQATDSGESAIADADGFVTYSRGGGRGARTSTGGGAASGFSDFHGGRGGGGGSYGGERGGRGRGGSSFGGERGVRGGGRGVSGGYHSGGGRGSGSGFQAGARGGDRGGGFGNGGSGGFRGRSSYARHNSFGMSEQAAQQ